MSDVQEVKPQNEEYANEAPSKRGFMAGFRAHCKRFWWIYLIAFIIVVLVVVLPVIYVAYPRIAQRDVDDSTLTITELEITDPRPDSLHLRVTQRIGTDSKYHPTLDAFEATLTLNGSDTPFATLNVPKIKAEDGAISKIDQELDLSDLDSFTEYAKAVMHNETVEFNVYGKTKLKEGGLPKTTVTYDKQVTMKGLNSLKGFNVSEFSVSLSSGDGPNLSGKVYIPNPSVMTLTMGNLTLDLTIDGQPVGTAFLTDVVIRPNDNFIDMESYVNQSIVLGLISDKYKNGIVPVQITGNSSVYNGEYISYFSDALASNTLTVELNLLDGLGGGN
ncbi:hypothetical protein VTO42DRAFT_7409 [Malbranchea cinnamomea]